MRCDLGTKNQEERFNQLRAAYVKRREKRDEVERALRSKYGIDYGQTLHDHWLTSPERKRRESADEATGKAADAFFEYVQSISPRDWSAGVPAHWIYEDLTYADAIRPKNESLSVKPPMAYGCTVHMV